MPDSQRVVGRGKTVSAITRLDVIYVVGEGEKYPLAQHKGVEILLKFKLFHERKHGI